MFQKNGRYTSATAANAAPGWTLERLTPPSQLFNANGMSTGADNRIYVAQGIGSQISAIDVTTGAIEVISARGGDIVGPDDLAFGPRGDLYVTEVMDDRVSVRGVNGHTRVLRDELPNANGITFYQDRLFIDECRHGGRLMELDLNGGTPRILLENLPMPNALAPGPDGYLYYPLLEANEIWRVHPETGKAERVVGDLGVPDAVKFDSKGFIVSTQVNTGDVLRIDPKSGDRTVLARLDPGMDNLTFVGERLFVSHLTDGRITEILPGGETKALVAPSLNWPLGLAVDADDLLYVADGFSFYAYPQGRQQRLSNVFDRSTPAGMRGVAAVGRGTVAVTTWGGMVALYRPWSKEYEVLAQDLDELYGIAADREGGLVVAELGTGRLLRINSKNTSVLASGLSEPMGVTVTSVGICLVSEAGAGRVSRVVGSRVETVLSGLRRPEGIAVHKGVLYVVDAGAQQLIAFDMETGARSTLVTDLPVGAPPGVIPKHLRGVPWFCGPLRPFAGLAIDSNGVIYLSGDAEGSVIVIRPNTRGTHSTSAMGRMEEHE